MTMRWLLVAGALVLATGACSGDPTGSDARQPTVLVTNATCEAGRCATLEIRAFVWKFLVPQPPQGLRVLGEAPPGKTCLAFPASWTLRVIGSDLTGRIDTTIFTWTPADTVPIYLIAVDSALFHGGGTQAQVDSSMQAIFPYDGLVPGSTGETPNFAPGTAPGWSVSFPGVRGSTAILDRTACEP